MNKICIITTVDLTLEAFVIPAARYMQEYGWDVTLACNMGDKFMNAYKNEFHLINVPMSRGSSVKDLVRMPFYFKNLFKKEQFDIVQYATPNAALYASLGAKLAGVKKRLYCQWGIRYVGFSGLAKTLFKGIEKFTCSNSTHIRPASWMNLDFAVAEGLYKRERAVAIGDGGTIGIDLKQFDIDKKAEYKTAVLEQYPQLKDKLVFCFVGRLNRDKGVFELLESFQRLSKERNDVALLQIGDLEGQLPIHLKESRQNPNIVLTGWTNEVPKYISASDVLVHPSYREGFSMVIQQAMAMELPVVTTDVPGPSEVIEKDVTGILAKARDVETLYICMKWMAEHPEERVAMGKAGRKRCEEKFTRERMLQLTLEDREQILNS
ncbi:glycosyltransferase family 4 protein [Bacteroides sp.]